MYVFYIFIIHKYFFCSTQKYLSVFLFENRQDERAVTKCIERGWADESVCMFEQRHRTADFCDVKVIDFVFYWHRDVRLLDAAICRNPYLYIPLCI